MTKWANFDFLRVHQISRKESKEYANLYLGLPHYFCGWLNPGTVRFWLSSIINTTHGHFPRYKDRNPSHCPCRPVYESGSIVSIKTLSWLEKELSTFMPIRILPKTRLWPRIVEVLGAKMRQYWRHCAWKTRIRSGFWTWTTLAARDTLHRNRVQNCNWATTG